jgi:hypothetical protein
MLIEPAWINGPRHEGRRWLSECRNCREGYGLSSKLKNTLRCKLLKIQGKIVWLGRRDSNPNNRVQSAVSYR